MAAAIPPAPAPPQPTVMPRGGRPIIRLHARDTEKPKWYGPKTLTEKEHQQNFYEAVTSGSLEKLKETVDLVHDINDFNRPFNENALHLAVIANRQDMVTLLLSKGADINFPSRDMKVTSIHFAARMNNVEMIKFLVSKGADFNATTLHKMTPLGLACSAQCVDAVKYFLSLENVNVNTPEIHGRTPMLLATDKGNLEIMKLLIDAGGLVGCYDSQRRNPFHYAVRRRFADAVRLLATAAGHTDIGGQPKGDIDLADMRGHTPLMVAVKADFLDMITVLLECGADPDMFGRVGGGQAYTATWEAVQCGHSRALKIIVDAGADVNLAENVRFGSPLFGLFMCIHSRPDILHVLLDAGIDVNYRNTYGYSALQMAVDTNRYELAVMLFQADYDVGPDVTWMRNYLEESRVNPQFKELLEWAINEVVIPMSLQSQVRLFIRNHLKHCKPLYKSVEALPFPKQTTDFLLYRDSAVKGEENPDWLAYVDDPYSSSV